MPATATAQHLHRNHAAARTAAAVLVADTLAAAGITSVTASWLPDHRRQAIAPGTSTATWAEACKLLAGAEASRPVVDPFAGIA